MFEDLPRHTLLRLTGREGFFLVKCKIKEYHGGEYVTCYLGQFFLSEVDCYTTRCYTNQIESIMEDI
jgi:hypothetical protein